jgi:hypothetical protein
MKREDRWHQTERVVKLDNQLNKKEQNESGGEGMGHGEVSDSLILKIDDPPVPVGCSRLTIDLLTRYLN